jgi:hypothetical protein
MQPSLLIKLWQGRDVGFVESTARNQNSLTCVPLIIGKDYLNLAARKSEVSDLA